MKKKYIALALTVYSSTVLLFAPSSGSHTLNVEVPEINSIEVGGTALNLTINDYVPGTDTPTGGNTAQTTFALTSNSATARYVSIAADAGISSLPAGASISVAPALGSGYTGSPVASSVSALSTSNQHVFTGISKLKIPNGTISYTLTAPASAGPIAPISLNITFTVTNA